MENYCVSLYAYLSMMRSTELALRQSSRELQRVLPTELKIEDRLVKHQWLEQDIWVLHQRLGIVNKGQSTVVEESQWRMECNQHLLASFIGTSYVLEGMTLGGQMIQSIVSRELGIHRDNGGRFFHAYGDQTPQMWKSFCDWANECDVDCNTAVEAANAMFQRVYESFVLLPPNKECGVHGT